MAKNSYIQKFNSYKKYQPSAKEIQVLKSDINRFVPVVNFFVRENKTIDPIDLQNAVTYLVQTVLDKIAESKYIDSRLYEFYAIEEILKEPHIIDKEYPNIKDIPNTHSMYTANHIRSQKLVLVNALDEVKKLEEFAHEYEITPDTKLENVVIKCEHPEVIINAIKLAKKILKQTNIKDKLLIMLETQKRQGEEFIRQNQIHSIKSLYEFFDTFGFNKEYMLAYNRTKDNYSFGELDYAFANDGSDGAISFTDSFSEDFLQTLSNQDLCFLNAFWCNRFAKECSRMNSAFCAINSLDLWEDIIKGQTEFSVPDEALVSVLRKSNFLTALMRDTFNIHQGNIYAAELKEGTKACEPLTKSYTDYYTKIHNTIQKDYKDFYSDTLVSNDFIDDVAFASSFVNLEMYAYQKKNTTLEPLIKNMLDHNHCKNWGIIRNEFINGGYVDSIKTEKPMILLSFDIEGFNMPFRFHVPKDTVMDLAKLSNGNLLIPEYQGYQDFIINNDVVPSNIVMPIQKHHKKIIMDNANSDGPNKNFWEHIYFLMNGKFPKHLTETVQKSKKQVITTRLPIHYTDLKTGKRYIKNKNQYIEVDNSNVR